MKKRPYMMCVCEGLFIVRNRAKRQNKIIPLISLNDGCDKEVEEGDFCLAFTTNIFLCILKYRGEKFCIIG